MHGDKIPTVQYTPEEVRTWGAVYERLAEGGQKWACKEYLNAMPKMEKYCGYGVGTVPQLQDISDYLRQTTGFQLRPIAGLLSARDFLNALAFRTFFSTQYMRHHGNPFYTPEPDVVHELLGHVPLFADMDFADFSQEIGLASIGASDEDIAKLATVYCFTVEFGVLREKGELKAYGAGLLSSFGELEWSCDDAPSDAVRDAGAPRDKDSGALLGRPTVHPFDPFQASKQAYPITTYQPVYFAADSFKDAKKKMDIFCDSMQRPFFPQYDALTQSIRVTKSVVRADRTNTVRLQAEKQREYMDHDGAD